MGDFVLSVHPWDFELDNVDSNLQLFFFVIFHTNSNIILKKGGVRLRANFSGF